MRFRFLKYSLAFIIPSLTAVSFTQSGWLCFLPLIFSFGFVPIVELISPANQSNLIGLQKEIISEDPWYDRILHWVVFIQWGFLIWFLFAVQNLSITSPEYWGRVTSLGMMCGILGINVAHELGHRSNKLEQFYAKLLLQSTLYTHFFIEHNYGHHKNVATEDDPATAKKNEVLFFFWIRSILYSYLSAWRIENKRSQRKNKSALSLKNEMIRITIVSILMLGIIYLVFSLNVLIAFLFAALIGILLLETVNYIEHYGLRRKKLSENRYEDTSVEHSWNSNQNFGRLLLFELTRHSDHHAYPHKKYQVLEHHDESPQLPAGYPSMMVLAFLPPIYFLIMNPRIPKS